MLNILIEMTAVLILLVPVLALENALIFRNSRRTLRYALFAFYLAAVYHIVGLPTVTFLTFDATWNLIPFSGIREDLKNAILNVFLFVPFGFFLPLLWGRYRRISETLLMGFCATLTIELAQLLTFRVTDINDILTNSLGCFLGFLGYSFLSLLSGKSVRPAGKTRDFGLILGTVGIIMFFLQPLLANLFYKFT